MPKNFSGKNFKAKVQKMINFLFFLLKLDDLTLLIKKEWRCGGDRRRRRKNTFSCIFKAFFRFPSPLRGGNVPTFRRSPPPQATPLVDIGAQGDPTKISYYRRVVGRIGKIFLLTYYANFSIIPILLLNLIKWIWCLRCR